MTPRRRRLAWILAIVLGTPAAFYALGWAYFVVVPSADDRRHRLAFDADTWRNRSADAGHEWPTRLRMADSLIERRLLDGLGRAQVEQLLGPADRTEKFRDWDLVYHLGLERRGMFRIDSEWLVIRLDSRGTVARYRIIGD